MVDALEIGYAIKDKRMELGLTQAQVAKAAGISERCLWALELGQNPGVQLNKLTAALGALGLELTISDKGRPNAKPDKDNRDAGASPSAENRLPNATANALAILTGGLR